MLSLKTIRSVCGVLTLCALSAPSRSDAQRATELDSLVSLATSSSPAVLSASARLRSARSRIRPAGAWPDPMLMAGIQNWPTGRYSTAAAGHGATPSGPEPMTMKMVGASQTIPYPGKTSLRERIATAEADAAEARLAQTRLRIAFEVSDAYYDLVGARLVLETIADQQRVAAAVVPAAESRYTSGSGMQADVIKARTEAAQLATDASAVAEEERAALVRLNAVLDRTSDTPVSDAASLPGRVIRAALGDSASPAQFTSASLGSRLVGSPLPSPNSLLAIALEHSPRLRELDARLQGQRTAAQLASKEQLPDFDVSIQYGQRDRLRDMISAIVSVSVPIQRGRKQGALASAARDDLLALDAERRAEVNMIRAEIGRHYSALERDRAQLAIVGRVLLPQARAALTSLSSGYAAGRGELLGVLDAQRSLFAVETSRVRTLVDFAKTLAALEEIVGTEVVR